MAMNFVYQFTTALNPQIIKSYAAGDFEDSQKLTLQSTVFVFDLVLLICLPLYFVIEPLLDLWLVEVPEMTVEFIRIALVSQVLGVFNITFYTPMLASGKLRSNSIWGLYIGCGQFVVVYILYQFGCGVLWLPYILLLTTVIYAFYIKPRILYKEIGYKIKDMAICYWNCFKVLIPSVLIATEVYYLLTPDTLIEHVVMLFCAIFTVMVCSILFMEKDWRIIAIKKIKSNFIN